MSRARLFFVVVGAIAAGAIVMALAASSDGPSENLEKQIASLAERVAALEKQVQTLKTSGGGGNAALEQEAARAIQSVNQLIIAGKTDEARTRLRDFDSKYKSTKAARRARKISGELAVVGKATPNDWGIDKWFQGESEINLSGKEATLVVFWETWCPHCRREVPKLQQVYENYKGKGLQVVGVTKMNRGSTEEDVTEFISQNKVSYPMAKEDGSLSKHFAVGGVPAAAVVKNGKVLWRGHPAGLTDDVLERMM